jgi:hypothetical protein
MSDRKAVIKNADMSEEMQQDAVDCATQVSQRLKGLPTSFVDPDLHHIGNLDPHPDPHRFGNLDPDTHQIKIRTRIKLFKLVPDLHQVADVNFLKGLSLYLKLGSGSGSASG